MAMHVCLVLLSVGSVGSSSSETSYGDMKLVEGVPVYNDRLDVQEGVVSDWLVSLNVNTSTAQVFNLCSNLPGNAECTFQGHPSEGGVAMINVRASSTELRNCFILYRPIISFAEPDGEWTIPDDPEGSFNTSTAASTLPWGLDRIDARFGLDGTYKSLNNGGRGVHVYVMDTGIRTTHAEFKSSDGGSRAVPTLESLGKVVECKASDTSCAADTHGHGTHCAGTVGGTNYGVAKGASLHAVKVLSDKGGGQWSWIIAALDWVATSGKRPAVVSASLGGRGRLASVEKAINAATAAGVTVVVAAGNDRGDACSKSPAFVSAAITVGATDQTDKRASFSNYGKCLDIFAPGVNILSAGKSSDKASATMSGTSMACPHVSGAAALLLEKDSKLSPSEVVKQLRIGATGFAVQDAKADSPNLLLYVGDDPPRTWTSTTTTTTRAPLVPASGFCGFESTAQPYCGIWHQSPLDKFDWTRKSGSTPSKATGPSRAYGGKYYVYTEVSNPIRTNDDAILEALTPTLKAGAFLSFFYHMNGQDMGILKVTVRSMTKDTTEELWSKSGEQGAQWRHQSLQLDRFSGEPVKISFVGIKGASYTGDIAIDDVMLSIEAWTGTTTTITTTTLHQVKIQIREAGGQGCLKSRGRSQLLEKRAMSGCATFLVLGRQFRSIDVPDQCLDYFGGRGWGLWNCHDGANQQLQKQGSRWCFGNLCIEEALLSSTTLAPSTFTTRTTSTTSTTATTSTATTTSTTGTFSTTTITTTTTTSTSATTTSTVATTTTPTTSTATTTSTASTSSTTTTITTTTRTTTSATTATTVATTTTSPVSESRIQSGDTVFLKARSGNGNYVDVEGVDVRARWSSQGAWQAMEIMKRNGGAISSGDVVYLKAHTGKRIDIVGGVVQARWDDTGAWQAITIEKQTGKGAISPDDIVCLRAHTGKLLDVEDGVVRARFEACGGWEAFSLEKEPVGALFSGDSINLLAHTGRYVEVDGTWVGARWTGAGAWQTMTIQNYGGRSIYSGDAVFLKAHTGAFLHVQDMAVLAQWYETGDWQKFIVQKKGGSGPIQPGDSIFLLAHTGKHIEVEGDLVQARWFDQGDWQTFVVEKAAKRRLVDDSTNGILLNSGTEQEELSNIFVV